MPAGRRGAGLVLDDELPRTASLNYTLTQLHVGDYFQHDWYATTVLAARADDLADRLGAHAVRRDHASTPGCRRCSRELVEAAEIDGAGPWRVFRDVTFPIMKPIFLILTSLSIIWDFGVFTQPFLLIGQSRINASNELMGIYLYEEGYVKTDFGRGAAISILMLADRRRAERLLRAEDGADGRRGGSEGTRARRTPSRRRGTRSASRSFVVIVVPGLLDGRDARSSRTTRSTASTPTWFPLHPTLSHFRDAINRAVLLGRTSRTASIVVSRRPSRSRWCSRFLAAVALAKFRFTGRKLFIVLMIGIQMLPQAGLIIPLYVVLARYHQVNALHRA